MHPPTYGAWKARCFSLYKHFFYGTSFRFLGAEWNWRGIKCKGIRRR
nr:MAG TPA: hypothetical protein [Caudoviricetes sp.]